MSAIFLLSEGYGGNFAVLGWVLGIKGFFSPCVEQKIKFQFWINWYYIDGINWFSGTIIELKCGPVKTQAIEKKCFS